MSIRALLRSFFQGVSQTLVVSVVLLALFNSTIWAPTLEASPSAVFSSTSADAAPATPFASYPPDKAPPSSVDRKAFAAEPTEAAAARAAVLPLKLDTGAAPKSTAAPQPSLQAMSQKLSAQRPVFVENKGQFDPRVRFQVRSGGKTLWLTDSGIVFDFVKGDPSAGDSSPADSKVVHERTPGQPPADRKMERHVICQDFVSADHDAVIEPKRMQEGTYNYFSGSDPAKWHTKVRTYSEVVYHNVWKGVDLRLYGNGSDLEQEFIVKPGAEISQVRVAYRGIEGLEVAKDGSLAINTAAGAMHESMPRIYQEKDGQHSAVRGQFELLSGTSYTFSVADHDPQYALVIDPTLLYSTYLGGSAGNTLGGQPYEVATGVAVDAGGSAYVTGYTRSPDFPVTAGAFQTAYAGAVTAGFVSKFNATGSALVYSSYIDETIYSPVGIAVDAAGNAYVAGTSGVNGFPTTANAYSQACKGNPFLSVLDPTGATLLYSTCFGPNTVGLATPLGITTDSNGHAFVVGSAYDGGVPTTPSAYELEYTGMPQSAFLTVFDTTASGTASLFYSTYLGIPPASNFCLGNGDHQVVCPATIANAVAIDPFGKAYIAGTTTPGLPVTAGAYQTTPAPCIPNGIYCYVSGNALIAKIDPTASGSQSLIYSTYFGGMGSTSINAIAVDASGNAYVTGSTSGSYYGSFPITPGAFQTTAGSNFSGASFVTKLNAGGSKLVYSTFVSDTRFSVGNGIAVDSLGNAHITGQVNGSAFPVTPDAFQSSYSKPGCQTDCGSAFLAKLNATGSGLIYSSYLGGNWDDDGTAVAVDQTGDAYVTGRTSSYIFPVTIGAFQQLMHGTGDAFVTKFPIGAPGMLSIIGITPNSGGNAGTVTPEIVGTGFHNGATTTLVCGTSTVQGSNPSVTGAGQILTATFDLTTTQPGSCALTVTNPDQMFEC